jgi:transcription initiation factor TFIIIB Brf1 subunit/transcription initiation factor TFIIB
MTMHWVCPWCESTEIEEDSRGQDHLCRDCRGEFTTEEMNDAERDRAERERGS